MYDQPRASTTLNGQKSEAFTLRFRTTQGCALSPLLVNVVLKVLASAIRQEEEINRIQIKEREVKLSLFADDMVLYIGKLEKSTKKLLEFIAEFSKVAR